MKLQDLGIDDQWKVNGGLTIIPNPSQVDNFAPIGDSQHESGHYAQDDRSSSLLGLIDVQELFSDR